MTDTEGDAILVFEAGPEPRLLDRANLPGSPYGIAIDNRRGRLWVTQTARNRVVEYELTDLAPKRRRSATRPCSSRTRVAVDPAQRLRLRRRPRRAASCRCSIPSGEDEHAVSGLAVARCGRARRPASRRRRCRPRSDPSTATSGAARCAASGSPRSSARRCCRCLIVSGITGFLSHAAYDPDLGSNGITGGFDDGFYFFDWPTSPAWLYSVTQGLHVLCGLAAIPILIAKLWSVIPKLFERPPVRSIGSGTGAAQRRDAGRLLDLPVRHRDAEHHLLAALPVPVHAGPLLRRDHLRRRAGSARGPEDPQGRRRPSGARDLPAARRGDRDDAGRRRLRGSARAVRTRRRRRSRAAG